MLKRFNYRTPDAIRLVALLLIFLIPFAIVVYQLIAEIHLQADVAQKELWGSTYLRPLAHLSQDVPRSRLLIHQSVTDPEGEIRPNPFLADIEQGIEDLTLVDQDLGLQLQTQTQYQKLQRDWQKLHQALQTFPTSAEAQGHDWEESQVNDPSIFTEINVTDKSLMTLHDQLMADIQALIKQVGDASHLILDSDLDSYYLMDVTLLSLPMGQELLANIQLFGSDIIQEQYLSPANRGELTALIGMIQANLQETQSSLSVVFGIRPDLEVLLKPALDDLFETTTIAMHQLRRDVVISDDIQISEAEYLNLIDASLQAGKILWAGAIVQLDEILNQRIQFALRKIFFVQAFTLLVLVAVAILFFTFWRNLVEQACAARRLNAQYAITQILASSSTFIEASPHILQVIGENLEWLWGEVWVLTPQHYPDTCLTSWQHPTLNRLGASLSNEADLLPSIGRPMALQVQTDHTPIWIESLQQRDDFEGEAIASMIGVQSAYGFPILAGTTVLGAITFLGTDRCPADADLNQMMTNIGRQIGQFMQRRQAEADLKQSEALQRMALSAAAMGVWDWNIETGEELWSDGAALVFGVDPEKFGGTYEDFLTFLHPEDRAKVTEAQRLTLEAGHDYSPEYRVLRPDGEMRWVTSRGNLLRNADGEPIRLTGITMDITDRKQAELALATSEQRLRQQSEALARLAQNPAITEGRLSEALQAIATAAAESLEVERVGIWLWTEDRTKLRCAELYDRSHPSSPINYLDKAAPTIEINPVDYPIYLQELMSARTISAADALTDRRLSEFFEDYLTPLDIRACLDAPIRVGGQVIGIVCHEQLYRIRDWSITEENFVNSIADFVALTLEVCERKRTETALRQAEEKYRSIFENAVTGIFQTTPDGHYLSANPALAEIYGYASPQHLMESLTNIEHQLYVDPHRREAFQTAIAQSDSVADFESQIYRRDGTKIWISENAIAVRDQQGRLLYYEGSVEDITARKQAQADLEESEERFRTLLNNIPGVFYRRIHNADWQMEFLSEAIVDICGYPASDFLPPRQRSLVSLIMNGDRHYVSQVIEDAIAQGKPYVMEYRLTHADGSLRWVYEKGQAIVDQEKQVRWLDGVIFDITDRKQAEQFLDQQQQILEAIASGKPLQDTLTLLINAVETQTPNVKGSILFLNPEKNTLHLGAAPSLPKDYLQHLEGLSVSASSGSCGTAAYRKSPVIVADIATDPLWTEFRDLALSVGLHACWSVPILTAQQEVLGTFALYHSQTRMPTRTDWELIDTATHLAGIAIERQRTEAELYQAKETAEESSHAKSQFLANMSHELRTPLNAIIGYSEMLEEDAEDFGYTDMLADLGKIQSAGRHLLTLINDILDISKIEAGRMELHLEPIDILALMQEVQSTALPMINKNQNQFQLHCATDIGRMNADLTKLRQILLNLLSNAAKFTHNGMISLAVEIDGQNDVSSSPAPGLIWITFTVADSGIGMSMEQLQRVFQAFVQADTTTTRKYGGTGLGLAISQRFCRMMGGDIRVRSQVGQGSTFTVRLPLDVDAAQQSMQQLGHPQASPRVPQYDAAIAPSHESSLADHPQPSHISQTTASLPTPKGTVLVIDDDENVQRLVNYHLGKEGFRVEYAKTGEAGLTLARSLQPTLITLDVLLPNMNGWDVLAALKADPSLADIPVVMMTILDEQDQGFALGASDYLTKPIDYHRLNQLLTRYRPQIQPVDGGRVLVVEDDTQTRELFRRLLVKEGWTVFEAEDGQQGLEQLQTITPDLILLDLMMPNMDGFQVIAHVRAHPDWRSLPVVVITAMELTEGDRSFLTGSVERVLEKGRQSRDDLLREIRTLVNHHLADQQSRGSV